MNLLQNYCDRCLLLETNYEKSTIQQRNNQTQSVRTTSSTCQSQHKSSISLFLLCSYFILILLFVHDVYGEQSENNHVYSNQFAVHIPEGGKDVADKIAAKHKFVNIGQVSSIKLKLFLRQKQ